MSTSSYATKITSQLEAKTWSKRELYSLTTKNIINTLYIHYKCSLIPP